MDDAIGKPTHGLAIEPDMPTPTPRFRIVAVAPDSELGSMPSATSVLRSAALPSAGGVAFEQVAFGGGEVGAVATLGDDLLIGLGIQLLRLSPDETGAFDVVARSPALPGMVLAIEVEGKLAYLGTSRGLVVVDVGATSGFGIVSVLDGPPVYKLAMVGHRLVVVAGDADIYPGTVVDVVEIVDASDPTDLTILGRLEDLEDGYNHVTGIAAAGSRVLLSTMSDGLVVIDVSGPGLPGVESVGLPIRDASGKGREVSYVGAGDGLAIVVDHAPYDPQDVRCAYVVEGFDRHWIRARSIGCAPGGVNWMAVDDAHAWMVSFGQAGLHVAQHALDGRRGTVRDAEGATVRDARGEVVAREAFDWSFVLYRGAPHALHGLMEAGMLVGYAFTPLVARAASAGWHDASRPIGPMSTLAHVRDVDACDDRVYALSVGDGDARWPSRLAPIGEPSRSEILEAQPIALIEPFDDAPEGSGDGVPAEQVACRGDMLAVVGTKGEPMVRLGLYEIVDGATGNRTGVAEQSSAHCYHADGRPIANRCGPQGAVDLRWEGDVIRADYFLDGPQWFDVADPRQPRLLDASPLNAPSPPRREGGMMTDGASVVRRGGYEFVVYPAEDRERSLDHHSLLAVLVQDAGPEADPIATLPLDTPFEVEAALLELGGRAFLLASSRAPGLHVIALDDPTAPQVVGHVDLPGHVEAIAVSGDLVHVALGLAGLVVLRARGE